MTEMARVPTWTELRLDVDKLIDVQHSCYRSVHQLLDQIPELDTKLSRLRGTSSTPKHVSFKDSPKKIKPVDPIKEPSIDQLEHLRPLPLPLCEYFKLNRPNLVVRANKRALYLKQSAEKRRLMASSRILSALERIRLSPRRKRPLRNRPAPPRSASDFFTPDYDVKLKFSEQEMKKLTAKIYKRLPEVRRKRKEEATNHMKVQNYKNRMEYGRKLLVNRRQGIINYPLRTNGYEQSITSSQNDDLSTISDQDDSQFITCARRAADPYF